MASMKVADSYAARPLALPEVQAYNPRQDSFDFRRTLLGLRRSIARHLLLIAATMMITIGVGVAYIMIWPPIFVADVLLAAESDKDGPRMEFYNSWHVFRKNQLPDEVQLFTAPSVLTRVVDRLGLTYDEVYHPFMSHVTYLWMTSTVGKTYRRAKEWVFPSKRSPYSPTPEQVDRARTIGDFRSGVAVDAVSDSSVGRLVVRGPTPRVAEIANTLVAVYLEMRIERQRREADNAYNALSGEVAKAREELRAVESRMEEYFTQNTLLLSMEKDKLDITRVETLRGAIIEIEASLASAYRTMDEIDRQILTEKPEIVSARLVRINPSREVLNDRLSQMSLQRRQLLIHYRADAPEVRDLDKQLGAVREQLAREEVDQVSQSTIALNDAYESLRRRKALLETEIVGQKAGLAVRRAEVVRLDALVATIPLKVKSSHELERERLLVERRYTALQDKLSIAAVSRAMASIAPATIQVIDAATAPDQQSWPQTKLILAGAAALGLLAGIGLAVLIDMMSGLVDRYRIAGDETGLDLYVVLPPDRRFAAHAFAATPQRGAELPPIGGGG